MSANYLVLTEKLSEDEVELIRNKLLFITHDVHRAGDYERKFKRFGTYSFITDAMAYIIHDNDTLFESVQPIIIGTGACFIHHRFLDEPLKSNANDDLSAFLLALSFKGFLNLSNKKSETVFGAILNDVSQMLYCHENLNLDENLIAYINQEATEKILRKILNSSKKSNIKNWVYELYDEFGFLDNKQINLNALIQTHKDNFQKGMDEEQYLKLHHPNSVIPKSLPIIFEQLDLENTLIEIPTVSKIKKKIGL